MPPLIAQIRHDAVGQNEKLWQPHLLNIISGRTYQNLEENLTIFLEIQSIFKKIC